MQRYRAYPLEIVSELEDLLHRREALAPPFERDKREQRISTLIGKLTNFRSPRPGDVVAGARLESTVGSGEFGQVWRAVREENGAPCAVKVFHPHRLGQGRMMREFRQGVAAMRALGRFNPPASIVTLWESDDSQLAFSMTLVQGHDLRNLAERGWSLEKKLEIFRTLCEAVQFAHSRHVIHRDLKPANIVIDEHSRPVLTDFDLADLLTLGTLTGRSAGSLAYAAPEQVDEQLGSKHGRRLFESDVYGLGRILLFLLTEQEPSILNRSTDLPELAPYPKLRDITRRCTKEDPRERYASVRDLLLDLRDVKTGAESTLARAAVLPHGLANVPPQEPTSSSSGLRHPLTVGLVTAGIGLVGALGAAMIVRPAPVASTVPNVKPLIASASSQAGFSVAAAPPVAASVSSTSPASGPALSIAAMLRRTAWLERGMGAHSSPGEVRPVHEPSLALEPDEIQLGSFRCRISFDAKGNPARLESCEGMGPARTAIALTLAIRCTDADDRSSVNCWSDKFSYSVSAKKKTGRFSLTLGLR
jgi:serine/threonine protein kinase